MKRPEPVSIKNYCSRSDCNINETGINLLVFLSCASCKEECSSTLKERVEKRSELEEDEKLESLYNGWIF